MAKSPGRRTIPQNQTRLEYGLNYDNPNYSKSPKQPSEHPNMIKIISSAVMALIGVFMLTMMFGSWYTVGQNETAVNLRNGAYVGTTGAGLHFKSPFFDDYVKFSQLVQRKTWTETDIGTVYSNDTQKVHVQVSVNYHIPANAVEEYYTTYGPNEETVIDNLIQPKLFSDLKIIAGSYTAPDLIGKRGEFQNKVEKSVKDSVIGRPIVIDSVQLESLHFEAAYEQSIEDNMQARIAVLKAKQVAEQRAAEADQVRNVAQGNADKIRFEGQAQADAIKARGLADAAAIEAKAKALSTSPQLIEYEKAIHWDGKLPTHMVPNGTIPFLDVNKQ